MFQVQASPAARSVKNGANFISQKIQILSSTWTFCDFALENETGQIDEQMIHGIIIRIVINNPSQMIYDV